MCAKCTLVPWVRSVRFAPRVIRPESGPCNPRTTPS